MAATKGKAVRVINELQWDARRVDPLVVSIRLCGQEGGGRTSAVTTPAGRAEARGEASGEASGVYGLGEALGSYRGSTGGLWGPPSGRRDVSTLYPTLSRRPGEISFQAV
jgi:hypothetical protein